MRMLTLGMILFASAIFSACGTNEPPKKEEPLSPPVVQFDAKSFFQTSCAPCHGPKGLGDGPAASALPNKPANLILPATQKKNDTELAKIISEGKQEKGMPPWKNALKEEEIEAVVKYLRELNKKK